MSLLKYFFGLRGPQIDIPCLHRVTKRLGSQLEELCLMNCSRLGGEQVLPIIQVCMIYHSLARQPPDRVGLVRALAGEIVLCSCSSYNACIHSFTLTTVPVSAHMRMFVGGRGCVCGRTAGSLFFPRSFCWDYEETRMGEWAFFPTRPYCPAHRSFAFAMTKHSSKLGRLSSGP